MNAQLPIFVIGQIRSGTSLHMQMLHAAGVECFGEYPAFEPPETVPGFKWRDILEIARPGMAIKLVDYHMSSKIPEGLRARIIVTRRRSYIEQAKSSYKLLDAVNFGGSLVQGPPTQSQLKTIAKSFRKANRQYYSNMRQWAPDSQVLHVSFEHTIRQPAESARRIARFVGADDAAAERMAACVKPRGVECYDGLLEAELLESRQ